MIHMRGQHFARTIARLKIQTHSVTNFTYEEILVIFRDCTEFLIDSDNNIRIVLMIVEFVEYIEFKGVLRRSS